MDLTGRTIHEIETPALLVEMEILTRNISMMSKFADAQGVKLRPHFKTSKMIQVARLQEKEGVVGFTCATKAEAQALLEAGFNDVFWAHAPASQGKARFVARANRTARLAVGIDSTYLGQLLSEAAISEVSEIPVLLEIDTGLARTGIHPDRAEEVAVEISGYEGLALVGVYTHEGQLAGMHTSREQVVNAGVEAARTLVSVAENLRDAGHEISVVSVGSTPGWDSAPTVDGVTEARAGTYVFFDANQVRLASAETSQCALSVLSTIVSVPAPQRFVIDAGIKAMSSDRSNKGDGFGFVTSLDGDALPDLEFNRAYEEHGILTGTSHLGFEPGDRVRVIPNHACGTVNMFSRVHIVEDQTVLDIWCPVGRH